MPLLMMYEKAAVGPATNIMSQRSSAQQKQPEKYIPMECMHILQELCAWQDNWAVKACAKIWCDVIVNNENTDK